jgi:hypothetical protein
MDPFVQMHEWDDFHHEFVGQIRAELAPQLAPRYFVRVERRVYLEKSAPEDEVEAKLQQRVPDVSVLKRSPEVALQPTNGGTATIAAPRECIVPLGEEHREYFLLIRGTESHEVITVLELLSPTNKRAGADGRKIYLEKRQQILDGLSHFVEIDLLRGGQRLPLQTDLPLANDYYALVSRQNRRPRAEIYQWGLAELLPTIRIPLAKGDADVPLDLQAVFAATYDRARYDLSIDYKAPLVPPPTGDEESVLRDILAGKKAGSDQAGT